MVPLDLREFAELRYRDGKPFGLALLELVDNEIFVDRYLELSDALAKATEKKFPDGEEWRHVEFLEEKQTLLGEIETSLTAAGFDSGDIDDRVTEVLAKLKDAETERDALRKELEELTAPKLEYDL